VACATSSRNAISAGKCVPDSAVGGEAHLEVSIEWLNPKCDVGLVIVDAFRPDGQGSTRLGVNVIDGHADIPMPAGTWVVEARMEPDVVLRSTVELSSGTRCSVTVSMVSHLCKSETW
jgi:hypothetical protein